MTPSDSCLSHHAVMHSCVTLSLLAPTRSNTETGLSGSQLFCRHPPSPITPGSSRTGVGSWDCSQCRLHPIRQVGRFHWRNEAESSSRFRMTADAFASPGFERRVTPSPAEVTTWVTNFCHDEFLSTHKNNQASPDAPDHHRSRRDAGDRSRELAAAAGF